MKWEYIYAILYIFWENYDMILVRLMQKIEMNDDGTIGLKIILWNIESTIIQ